ncbi:metal-binding protein [Clostridium brassicae]|uniref:Metal-binding protein n=1 Tax=Clostridium brassicae TaxID=2999072 RepID=A0ABT4DE03_9CLOT|nr:metal-binding protein [Clostridium brassicae]MCY6960538.1 metal-binding protein [Clostridium brassicae]
MVLNDIMKYIESEYGIINSTPCEICGGSYMADELEIHIIDNIPYDVCVCVCSECGHEKLFTFCAPFLDEKDIFKNAKGKMN